MDIIHPWEPEQQGQYGS